MGTNAGTRGGLWSVGLLTVSFCSLAASPNARAEDEVAEGVPFRVRVAQTEAAYAVKRALRGADRRLAEPACRQVLTDFRVASGVTPQDVLEASGVSGRMYLRWIVFADGRGTNGCRSKATLAVTEPGSRVVFICPQAFLEDEGRNRAHAEATLIHEMLHTLGLGENPPRSAEITERVLSRCGSDMVQAR